jgi:hypothetical protein
LGGDKSVKQKTMIETNKILDQFGQNLAERCFDSCLLYIDSMRHLKKPFRALEENATYIQSLEEAEYKRLLKFIPQLLVIQLSNVLQIFEENEQFKLLHQEGDILTNLAEISEMLSSEASTEYGWIARFSKVLKDDQRIPPLL